MSRRFTLPDLGEGIAEAVIVRWHVAPGDRVSEGDPLLEVETDKAIVEIPSPYTGTVERLGAGEGERVPVGTLLVEVAAAGEAAAPAPPPGARSAERPGGPALASAPAPEPAPALGAVRGRLVRHLSQVQREVPAVTVVEECDFTELELTLGGFERKAFNLKLASAALDDVPELNATFEQDGIVRHDRHDIGLAVQGPEALLVPVVRAVDRRPLAELAADVQRLTEGAQAGRLAPADLHGSTFTVTDAGRFGGLFATPLINAPEIAVLGLHRVDDRPVVRAGEVVVRRVGNVSCTFDHRAVDGFHAGAFLLRFVELAQAPAAFLASLDEEERDPAADELVARLAGATAEQRSQILLTLVREHVASLLEQGSDAIDSDLPFQDLGLDSLTAVELRDLLARATGLRLDTAAAIHHPTPAALADHLLAELASAERI
jgi:pyruvate/2-oxoglutarate dehydrogenase complex dihydrolipoamide acyltransferase (E2) component/acyl carrier protein